MNVSELARRVKISTRELLEIIPVLGFDIGKKAIKINDKVAEEIINILSDPKAKERYLALTKDKEKSDQEVKKEKIQPPGEESKIIEIADFVVVKELAKEMNIPVTRLIMELMKNGVMTSLNESIDYETAAIISEDLGFKPVKVEQEGSKTLIDDQSKLRELFKDDPKNLRPRPPVVVVMGHVDHGKTKLLDAIRQTNVVDSESGGITQHIGAYQVVVSQSGETPSQSQDDFASKGREITFIDTPGHEAFAAMRSRGVKVADIAILVVAADDGIQPQTIEAVSHIRRAGLQMVVAINKIDKEEANVDKIKSQLAELDLTPEGWGGKTICVEISAKKKINIPQLLDTLLLVADLEKDKILANPSRPSVGTIIESHVDRGEGPVATVLVQTGTLKSGDFVKVGNVYGRIRTMKDFQGKIIKTAPPSTPTKILGLKAVSQVGEILQVMIDKKIIRKELRQFAKPHQQLTKQLVKKRVEKDEEKEIPGVNIYLKADVLGSVGAILEALDKIPQDEVRVDVIHQGLGNITESDILKAEDQNALLLGFHVSLTNQAKETVIDKKVKVKTFEIIYDLVDLVKEEVEKLIIPKIQEVLIAQAQVLKIFKQDKESQIVGVKVISGKVENNVEIKVYRGEKLITQGKLVQLQSAKEDVVEVVAGQEAGLNIEDALDIQGGDKIEFYKELKSEKKRVISSR